MTATPETLARAKAFWNEREKKFPRFVRQTWENGTYLAKEETIREVMRRDEAAESCPSHIASAFDAKVCGRCGIHIEELRPDEGEL